MKWSWNLGRIFGIDLKIHSTFVLLLIWIAISTLIAGGDFIAVGTEILLILALFMCVVFHELGHALMARRFGIPTKDITLLPIGGVARLDKMPEKPKEELLVAIAGPAVNLFIGTLLFSGLLLTGAFSQGIDLTTVSNSFWLQLMVVNFTLVAFNLIPAFPMDGGRILKALLALKMTSVKATRLAANIGRGIAVLMGIAGFFFNPWLILTAIFVWYGAGAEARSAEINQGLKGLVVRDALISQFYQVEANQPLSTVFQLSLQTGQHNLPVVSNGHFLGIIRRADLLNALDKMGERAPAYAAIGAEPEGVNLDMPLTEVLPLFSTNRVLPVIENRQLMGLITPESVQQRLWLNRHTQEADRQPPKEKINPI
ncbi:MAG: site-2 protease family protein [Anaerolineales bacterium]